MDLKSKHFKSINLKSKSKSKFSNTTYEVKPPRPPPPKKKKSYGCFKVAWSTSPKANMKSVMVS